MNPQQEKTFVVSLKGLAPWISSVKYEKGGEDLKLYFTIRKEGFSPENFSLQEAGQNTLIVGNESQQNNAAVPKKNFFELLASQQNPISQLLGKALESIEYLPSHNAYLASLEEIDLGRAKLLPRLFSMLKQSFGEQSSYLVFFESQQRAQGVGWIVQEPFLQKILQSSQAQQKGNWVLLSFHKQSLEQMKHDLTS